jgi:hypothetical protein
MRLLWTLGSHERRVFFFENGTLLPDCLVFPWKSPSWDLLNGRLMASKRLNEGNMAVGMQKRGSPRAFVSQTGNDAPSPRAPLSSGYRYGHDSWLRSSVVSCSMQSACHAYVLKHSPPSLPPSRALCPALHAPCAPLHGRETYVLHISAAGSFRQPLPVHPGAVVHTQRLRDGVVVGVACLASRRSSR